MRRPGRRSRGERGTFLLIMTLSLVLLCTVVAFAVDLGQGRFSKRDSQQSADLASLSAGFYLSGNGSGATVQSQPQAACQAAFASLLTNTPGFTPTATPTSACSVFPATNVGCTTSTTTITATDTDPKPGVQGGPYDIFIEWPVPDGVIADTRFSGSGAGVEDGDACDRMRIRIDKRDPTTFGRLVGVDGIDTSVDAVVKGAPGLPTTGVAALLLLEREGCSALQASGQGRVIVKAVIDPATMSQQPGVIQADSAGSSTDFGSSLQCTNNPNPGGYVIYGTALPASAGGGPSIIAESTSDGELGVIATHAATVGGRAACCHPGGLNVEPIGSDFTSRTPADDRFNPPARPAIDTLHADAYAGAVTNGATVVGQHFTPNCNNPPATFVPTVPNTAITIDCGNNPLRVGNGQTVTISNASTVKFIGGVDVAGTLEVRDAVTVVFARRAANQEGRLVVTNTGTASLNSVRNVYVGGKAPGNPQRSSVSVAGRLRVNTGALATTTCAPGPGAGGTAANWVRFATVGGEVDVSGSVSLCQTMVYVGKSTAAHAPDQRVAGGLNCSTTRPCPAISTADSRDRLVTSGGASVLWTAPNQTASAPTSTNPFEGLSLWLEGTGVSQIKGTGTIDTTGVYFLPNARFQFDGQASATNPFNAQFFARTLDFSGQGDLNLSPDPRDSVPTPIPGSYSIIR